VIPRRIGTRTIAVIRNNNLDLCDIEGISTDCEATFMPRSKRHSELKMLKDYEILSNLWID
jgi:hypothetical protein